MNDLTIRELQKEAHQTALQVGWWNPGPNIPEAIALMHSELSEALEEWRSGLDGAGAVIAGEPAGLGFEFADCIIRIADLCEYLGFDLTALLRQKMAYNKTRPYRHGGKRL